MQLRLKITALLVGVITFSVIANYAIQRMTVIPSFRALEQEAATEDWERCRNAINREVEALSGLCFDWASWDDAYGFVQDKYPVFYEANLKNPNWFVDQHIDVLYFVRPDGTVYWRHVAEVEEGKPTTLAWMPQDRLPPDHPLLAVTATKDSHVTGIARTELGFLMVAAHPILTSQNEGPMAGVLIFGRRLGAESVETLRAQTGVHFDLLDVNSPDLSAATRAGLAAALEAGGPVEELLNDEQLAVRGVLPDVSNAPLMVLETTGLRHISQQGESAVSFATVSLVTAGGLTLVTLLLALSWLVIKPLGALTSHAARVGESGRMTQQLNLNRTDELGTLARAFDTMLAKLEELRASSVTMSRQAGMAEVAAGVLHNVGNAMTNVNVLAETLTDKLARSKVPSLGKVSALLDEHRGDLPGFFSSGSQGQQLPGYIAQLAAHLNNEIADVQHDLNGLRDGLQHVKQIVAAHQSIASTSNFTESVPLGDIVDASLTLVHESLHRHGVEVTIDGDRGLVAELDRSKLSQVLVNLLTNAKDALTAARTQDPKIAVRIGRSGPSCGWIEVSDNGPGIPPEHAGRVFNKGFTTKAEGHGIGLHYCWLALREMNGSLSLVDGGYGTGATFRVELPVPAVKEHAAS